MTHLGLKNDKRRGGPTWPQWENRPLSVGTAIINEMEEKYKDGNEVPAPRHGAVFSGTCDKIRNGPQYAGDRDRAYQVKGTFTGSGPERKRAMEGQDHRAVWMRIEEAA